MSPPPGSGTSIYAHVPFCQVKCGYCDFNSYTVENPQTLDRFLSAFEADLRNVHLPEEPVSVYVGGGTPTLLDAPRLERFLNGLSRHVDLRGCAEVTMEANPESVTVEKAAIAREAGVRRISMGAQSFQPELLGFLDRVHSADRTRQAVGELRDAGCDNLSLDLIYSIPGQTLPQWAADLETALGLHPEHLSCYMLTFEPGTRLHRDLRNGGVRPNDEELERDMFLFTRARLEEAGFTAYEISNFAGRGGPSLHNDHYWLQGDYVGIGPGASSHRAGVRSTNVKAVNAWADCIERGAPPVAHAETLSPRQRAGEALWLGIRRQDGVDLIEVAQRLGVAVVELFERAILTLQDEGLVDWDGRRIRLSDSGLLFANTVGERFLMPA